MAIVSEKVIFLSHAFKDKDVVQVFADRLFDNAELKKQGFKLFFTSTEELEYRLPGGADTWREILDHLDRTEYFLAFLSDYFFTSEWCVAELAIFQQQITPRSLPQPVPILIDGDAEVTARNSPLTQHLNLSRTRSDDLERLVAGFKSRGIPHKSVPDYRALGVTINTAISNRNKLKKGDFFELARQHFLNPRTSNNPISFFVDRGEYEQTSVSMGMAAMENLLWTVFQSPLLVADAYDDGEKLMHYDKKFEHFQAHCKIRLVIFQGPVEARAYDLVEETWHNDQLKTLGIAKTLARDELTRRKQAFETVSTNYGGILLFTDATRLPRCSSTVPPPKYDMTSPLEFACGDYGERGAPLMLMETGFSSAFSLRHCSGIPNPCMPPYGHVTFYRPLEETPAVTIKNASVYREFYGHLAELWQIAKSVFRENRDSNVFVEKQHIAKLY